MKRALPREIESVGSVWAWSAYAVSDLPHLHALVEPKGSLPAGARTAQPRQLKGRSNQLNYRMLCRSASR